MQHKHKDTHIHTKHMRAQLCLCLTKKSIYIWRKYWTRQEKEKKNGKNQIKQNTKTTNWYCGSFVENYGWNLNGHFD